MSIILIGLLKNAFVALKGLLKNPIYNIFFPIYIFKIFISINICFICFLSFLFGIFNNNLHILIIPFYICLLFRNLLINIPLINYTNQYFHIYYSYGICFMLKNIYHNHLLCGRPYFLFHKYYIHSFHNYNNLFIIIHHKYV